MALSNVALTDTFYTWLTRTNQLVVLSDQISIKANDAYNTSNTAFDKANVVAISSNAWTNTVATGANGWANIVAAGANSWSNTVVAGANAWVNTVFGYTNTSIAGSNAWTNVVFGFVNTSIAGANAWTNTSVSGISTSAANGWANTVVAGANGYANTVSAAANSFANTIGVRANAWTNTVVAGANAWVNTSVVGANAWSNTKLSNTSGITFAGVLIFPSGTGSAPSITFAANTTTGIFSNTPNAIQFSTVGAQRMKISNTGNVSIALAADASYPLHVGGIIYATDDIVSASDMTLKENISSLENSLSVINKLNPVKFTFKRSDKVKYGLLAQEVKNVLPELVIGNEGNYGVGYLNIIALLIDSVKELNKEIKELKDKINDNQS